MHVHVMADGVDIPTRMVRDLRAESQGKDARDMLLVPVPGTDSIRPVIRPKHMKRIRPLEV
jgi:hypothetical protein